MIHKLSKVIFIQLMFTCVLYGQVDGGIFKFKNQFEIGLSSTTYIPKSIKQGIREIYSPFAYLAPSIKSAYIHKFKFGRMDYGYKRVHFILASAGLNVNWMPTIDDKISYTGFNRKDSTLKDTVLLSKNRNGRATLAFFLDYTREFKPRTGIRYRFGLGFEHHLFSLIFNKTTINKNPYTNSTELIPYPISLFSFNSTSFNWWARVGIDKRFGNFNYFGSAFMLGYGPEYQIVSNAKVVSSLKFAIQLHIGILGGSESVVRRK